MPWLLPLSLSVKAWQPQIPLHMHTTSYGGHIQEQVILLSHGTALCLVSPWIGCRHADHINEVFVDTIIPNWAFLRRRN